MRARDKERTKRMCHRKSALDIKWRCTQTIPPIHYLPFCFNTKIVEIYSRAAYAMATYDYRRRSVCALAGV